MRGVLWFNSKNTMYHGRSHGDKSRKLSGHNTHEISWLLSMQSRTLHGTVPLLHNISRDFSEVETSSCFGKSVVSNDIFLGHTRERIHDEGV